MCRRKNDRTKKLIDEKMSGRKIRDEIIHLRKNAGRKKRDEKCIDEEMRTKKCRRKNVRRKNAGRKKVMES